MHGSGRISGEYKRNEVRIMPINTPVRCEESPGGSVGDGGGGGDDDVEGGQGGGGQVADWSLSVTESACAATTGPWSDLLQWQPRPSSVRTLS